MDKIAVDSRCLEDARKIDCYNFMDIYQESILSVSEIPADTIADHRAYFFRVMQNAANRLRQSQSNEKPTDPHKIAALIPEPTDVYIDPDTHHPDSLLDELLESPAPTKREYYTRTLVKQVLKIGSVTEAARHLKINRSSIYHAFWKVRKQIQTQSTDPTNPTNSAQP